MEKNKLNMKTNDITEQNIEKIKKLFPNVITEKEDDSGKTVKAIDFDLLKQILSKDLVEDSQERYTLNWPGKKASILKANTPITKTLRPVIADSVDFENTENLYLEGDNFEVLKILQESYLNKIKMIYIDPPYNTGKDFIYKDKFSVSQKEHDENSGAIDEDGYKMFKNTDSNGKYHSDWLSMMYERLLVARDLLTDDGVIFMSIDDNEVHNLRKISDEIFGEENFVELFIWKSGRTASSIYTREHEYILVYAKRLESVSLLKYNGKDIISDRTIKKISTKNPAGEIKFKAGVKFLSEDKIFPNIFGKSEIVEIVDGVFECKNKLLASNVTIKAGWAMKDMIESWFNNETVVDSKGQVLKEFFFKENGVLQYTKQKGTVHPKTIITDITTKNGTNRLKILLGFIPFDYPKAPKLINYFLKHLNDNEIIIDFFSGSATTADAVMQLNAEDGGNRKFIMVQLPEKTDEKSEAFKAGYKNICEIGKERIRRAGNKIKSDFTEQYDKELEKLTHPVNAKRLASTPLQFSAEPKEGNKIDEIKEKIEKINNLDIGFRVYKVDETNMKEVYYHPLKLNQKNLDDFATNIKDGRTSEDLLTQVILDLGLKLSLPIEKRKIKENEVFFVRKNSLIACFDKDMDFSIIDEIAKVKPLKVVFRDASFKNDADLINLETKFKELSPDTQITVL